MALSFHSTMAVLPLLGGVIGAVMISGDSDRILTDRDADTFAFSEFIRMPATQLDASRHAVPESVHIREDGILLPALPVIVHALSRHGNTVDARASLY